ncbi:sn-glycerol-3-phosphate import ATP-binding protein UgpC 1 [uncultured Pleomorphomonas sp.]|uniref:sn-glycerol-3-phosphate import ATP-binding protein UgpC 1 n=1 Tax=uncultured Pleomorphomonas sp. TaxID=442121 RepID=A0A212LFA8_9HYPH|nr:ABC transporter ATP-binding protein [uncultured Pleomorphomonas sp.]SCM76225.1 sn-glycerol-3-phosphate import ATP-binding protein UgpC 1 [uncultured Pleomorphomonas sp.]
MARVDIEGIEKRFNGEGGVHGVTLSVQDGEFLAILGPSGCGKSTLLRLIAGLERPTAGRIRLGGRDATGLHPKDRDIAMVFQNYALYPHLTLRENIAFPLKVKRLPRRAIDTRVAEVADMVGIGHLLGRKPRQVSGGERQRAALARALVRKPALFLLDEPLSNLDAKLRQAAREELKALQRRTGLTALYVTHDQVEAMGLGDRIVVMQAGRIRQIGTPEEVYRFPGDTFVATFIGTPPMNIVDHGDLLVGFRPETVIAGDAAGPAVAFPVVIRHVEYLGNVNLVYADARAPGRPVRVVAALPSQSAMPFSPGQETNFRVDAADLRFFDKATGLAVRDAGVTARFVQERSDG